MVLFWFPNSLWSFESLQERSSFIKESIDKNLFESRPLKANIWFCGVELCYKISDIGQDKNNLTKFIVDAVSDVSGTTQMLWTFLLFELKIEAAWFSEGDWTCFLTHSCGFGDSKKFSLVLRKP